MELEKSGIKICLLVEHGCPEMSHSMYVIEPPLEYEEEKHIDSEGFMIESISPVITVKQRGDCFITQSAMVKLGSRVYLFGGLNNIHDFNFFWKYDIHENIPTTPDDEQKVSVRVLDVDHPELGLLSVASLNAPKQTPCVFSARGMIYALGSLIPGDDNNRSGCFERYDPAADKWQLLPDPPLSLKELEEARWCDCATVVRDRYVFVGDNSEYLIFDLDTQEWAPLPPSHFFPCGSLYVDGSLYYLRGRGAARPPATQFDPERRDHLGCKLELAKRGPLLDIDDPSRLLKSHCLLPKNAQVMATVGELDEDTFFTSPYFPHWRDIFHLGGRFFCYVVTSQLVDWHSHTIIQPYCRGVRIKVFEEVPSFNSSHEAHFRTLASFCYKIRTPFPNDEFFIRCCAFGSVPDAWVKAPLKKKQVVTTERKDLKAEQSHGGGSYGQRNCNLEKIVAAREEENMRLKAELARKDELLKAFMAKSEGKLVQYAN